MVYEYKRSRMGMGEKERERKRTNLFDRKSVNFIVHVQTTDILPVALKNIDEVVYIAILKNQPRGDADHKSKH